jgi:hypothetical protein
MQTFASAGVPEGVVQRLADETDARLLWILADWLQFTQGSPLGIAILETAEQIAGVDFDDARPWGDVTEHLLAWDLPGPPGHQERKGALYALVDPRWDFIFSDPDATIDYRWIGWGGVPIDDRELGDPNPCTLGCIPALDDPALTPAEDGDWFDDDGIVFAISLGDSHVAFPRNIMEIHEMVNITIDGKRLGIPYCTLCGSAQAFVTSNVLGADEPMVLRTSGLLSRSNKVMYDLETRSVFDTFTGQAVSGPLRDLGITLEQVSVATSRWGDWREAHPDTLIVAEDGGIGRSYPEDPLAGRDDDGPIVPIGSVDARLGVQEAVVGVELGDGSTVAFPVQAARATLQRGESVSMDGVELRLDGTALRAYVDDSLVASHEAFWFAWSQFHPDTGLWLP